MLDLNFLFVDKQFEVHRLKLPGEAAGIVKLNEVLIAELAPVIHGSLPLAFGLTKRRRPEGWIVDDETDAIMLPEKIKTYLNKGYSVAAELPSPVAEARCFVRIRALASPNVPREEFRYLNSRYSMWDYWKYEFRWMVLRSGWEHDDWNYDRYLLHDEHEITRSEAEFCHMLRRWIPDPECLRHSLDSDCPD